MLPRKNRVRASQFNSILGKGRLYHSAFFSLRYAPSPDSLPRFSAVVSKKVAPTAVKRNLWKRKVRNIAYPHLKEFKPGLSVLVFLKKEALGLKNAELKREVESLLAESGVLF